MNVRLFVIAAAGALALAASGDFEQQLRSKYQVTNVRATGKVTGQPGSVLTVRVDGLVAIPASYGPYWYCVAKKGGPVKTSTIQHGGTVGTQEKKPLQVGERVYLTNIEIKPSEIGFFVQSCGACDPAAADPNEMPYRVRLGFQFEKNFLGTADFKQIEEAIGQVFGVESGAAPAAASAPANAQPAASGTEDAVLRNQDIIELTKAGIDDATILAKIAASKCQFDTSTTALIELKKAGASGAVIKAVVAAGK